MFYFAVVKSYTVNKNAIFAVLQDKVIYNHLQTNYIIQIDIVSLLQ